MTHCNSMLPVSLIVLAAGLGSRFGGDKQLSTIGDTGKPLMYFSVMDAYHAGVRDLVLVINDDIEQAVSKHFLTLLPKDLKVSLVLQRIDDLPHECVAGSRRKPWGTGHALWSARKTAKAGCIVINADDYYGPRAMKQLLRHFSNCDAWAMVSYQLRNTLSEFGAVNRGLCADKNGLLVSVKESLSIKLVKGVVHGEIDGMPVTLAPDTPVSMNIWGFGPDIFDYLEKGLIGFFTGQEVNNKAEFYLPAQVMSCINAGENHVCVYPGRDQWYGITYREDLARLGEIFKTWGQSHVPG